MFAIESLKIIEGEFLEATISSTDEPDTIIIEAEILPTPLPLQVQRVRWSTSEACAASILADHEEELRELLSAAL